MEKISIYVIDMNSDSKTSGVDRYISNLIEGISSIAFLHVYRIQLTQTSSIISYTEVHHKDYTEVTIPTPQDLNKIIREKYWSQKYNQQVFSLIRHLFVNNDKRIIHIHTLNLIDLALYIKNQVNCKIITHLHCIPWKSYYNSDKRKFNFLYYKSEIVKSKKHSINSFITHYNEWSSYTSPDQIICVTKNAKKFLRKTMQVSTKASVIPNGIKDDSDYNLSVKNKESSDLFQLLFVGNVTESKGILFILEALNIVKAKGYNIQLIIAGSYENEIRNFIKQEYRELSIQILGKISLGELKTYYKESDIGIIASLQEQCSYVALEMAMFGLPVITTAVDGLDEIFQDNVNALKVNTTFSRFFGLNIDVEMLSDKIIALIEDRALREKIGKNARKLYEERYKLNKMIRRTVNVYKKITYE